MTEIVLLRKLYGPSAERCRLALQRTLDSIVTGLEAGIRILGLVERGWVKVEVQGEDEAVAINQLHRRFGLTPSSLEALKLPCIVNGYAIDVGKVGYGIYVDVGLSSPNVVDALVPLHTLRAQLVDGSKVSVRRIAEAYGLIDNLPLSLRLTRVDIVGRRVEAELSDAQVALFEGWVRDGLERVIALGVPLEDAEEALRMSGLRRDVVGIESLGLFEHSFLCKPGTQAPGIIGGLGRYLPRIPLCVFSPSNLWLKERVASGRQALVGQ